MYQQHTFCILNFTSQEAPESEICDKTDERRESSQSEHDLRTEEMIRDNITI